MPEGVISSFDPETNQGQIETPGGGPNLPFHASDVQGKRKGEALQPNQPVTFDVEGEGDDAQAINIQTVADHGYGA